MAHVTGAVEPFFDESAMGLFASTSNDDLPPRWDLHFWVPGIPQTAGSKTRVPIKKGDQVVAQKVIESGDRVAKGNWRDDLRTEARRRIEDYGNVEGYTAAEWPTDFMLLVEFTFVRPRPASHYGTGKNADVLKDRARGLRPSGRPDALKLARAAEDALTKVIWTDDARIVDERLRKVYPDQIGRGRNESGALVAVRRLAPS